MLIPCGLLIFRTAVALLRGCRVVIFATGRYLPWRVEPGFPQRTQSRG